jgi:uncharacterized protein (TIGR02611 family)
MACRRFLRLDELSPGMRRIVAGLLGGSVLLIGLVMIVLPGPAFIVIPLGLAILATEFFWARRILMKAQGLFRRKKTDPVADPSGS